MNLRGIDLNLMTIFEAVYEERSQSAAARRLGMTPSAISVAVKRLMVIAKDGLFETHARGVHPSRRADQLYLEIHQALDLIRKTLANQEKFDPASSHRVFTATMGYGGGVLFGLPLYRRMRQQAPDTRLAIRGLDPFDEVPRLLAGKTLDFALHYECFPDDALDQTLIVRTELVVIASMSHPRIREGATMADFMAEEFVGVSQFEPKTACREYREFLDVYRTRVYLEVPNATMLPLIVNASEMLAVTTRRMAASYGSRMDLRVLPLPVPGAIGEAYLIWHRSMEHDPAHVWLREQIDATFPDAIRAGLPG